MSNNDPHTTQKSFLGQPANRFIFMPLGEDADIRDMPADDDIAASTVIHFEINKDRAAVTNTTIVPHHLEITLPVKVAMLATHEAITQTAGQTERSPIVDELSRLAMSNVFKRLDTLKRDQLGGLTVLDDGTTGLYVSEVFPQQINRATDHVLGVYGPYPSASKTKMMHEIGATTRGATDETIEKVSRLIIGWAAWPIDQLKAIPAIPKALPLPERAAQVA